MQRCLREQGETFRAVLNRTREALVRHYLKRPEITAEISFLLSKGRRAVLLLTDWFAAAAQVGVPANGGPAVHPERRTVMRSRPLMTLRLTTGLRRDSGSGPHGARVVIPITGGAFEGDRLRGKVLPGGDDATLTRSDGVVELDERITLETDDGALIYMTFQGLRDDRAPGGPYFRTLPRFETAEPKYSFLNRLLAVGTGEIQAGEPVHVIEEIL